MALLAGETENAGIEMYGFGPVRKATRNLTTAPLFEEAIRRGEGLAAAHGPLVVKTGKHTGRSPNDKFFVEEPGSKASIGHIADGGFGCATCLSRRRARHYEATSPSLRWSTHVIS